MSKTEPQTQDFAGLDQLHKTSVPTCCTWSSYACVWNSTGNGMQCLLVNVLYRAYSVTSGNELSSLPLFSQILMGTELSNSNANNVGFSSQSRRVYTTEEKYSQISLQYQNLLPRWISQASCWTLLPERIEKWGELIIAKIGIGELTFICCMYIDNEHFVTRLSDYYFFLCIMLL